MNVSLYQTVKFFFQEQNRLIQKITKTSQVFGLTNFLKHVLKKQTSNIAHFKKMTR